MVGIDVDRRTFLAGAAAGAVSLLLPGDPGYAALVSKVIWSLPAAKTQRFAWTVDDGVSSHAVTDYLKFSTQYNLKFTFFVTSCYQTWQQNKAGIAAGLASGRIQLGNHSHTHKNWTHLTEKLIRQDLMGCHNRMLDLFGYDMRPYFRPPYGLFNDQVLAVAAAEGYTKPMMWNGSLADSGSTNQAALIRNAKTWIGPGRIVIDHANSTFTADHFSDVLSVVRSRGLSTVTLREVFG
jgi:peptidoglycan/xylan/chitin deacetylase (PgdA/CDA1 family)